MSTMISATISQDPFDRWKEQLAYAEAVAEDVKCAYLLRRILHVSADEMEEVRDRLAVEVDNFLQQSPEERHASQLGLWQTLGDVTLEEMTLGYALCADIPEQLRDPLDDDDSSSYSIW